MPKPTLSAAHAIREGLDEQDAEIQEWKDFAEDLEIKAGNRENQIFGDRIDTYFDDLIDTYRAPGRIAA